MLQAVGTALLISCLSVVSDLLWLLGCSGWFPVINVSPSCSCVLGGCQAIAMWLLRCLSHCYSVATVLLGCSGWTLCEKHVTVMAMCPWWLPGCCCAVDMVLSECLLVAR